MKSSFLIINMLVFIALYNFNYRFVCNGKKLISPEASFVSHFTLCMASHERARCDFA